MANTATQYTAIPVGYDKGGKGALAVPVQVAIDTVDTDLTVYTPPSDAYWALIGIQYSEATAHTLTFKSGSTTLVPYERPADSGLTRNIGEGIVLTGLTAGATCVIRSSAAITQMILYFQPFRDLRL